MKNISKEKIWEMFEVAEKTIKYTNVKPAKSAFGAAILGGSGKVYSGCSFDGCPTDYCAERVALLKALSEGEKKIEAILVSYQGTFRDLKRIGGTCGVCLNALYQLGGRNLNLPMYTWPTGEENWRKTTLGKLYPEPF
jgi:cytidine deaminase